MRIGFAIPSFEGGGAESVTRHWATTLAACGHRVFGYTFDRSGAGSAIPEGMTHRHFSAPAKAAKAVLLPVWLRRQAGRDRLDVMVTMMTFANLAVLAGLRGPLRSRTAVAIVEHSVPTVALPLQNGGSGARTKRRLARRLYRRADAAVGVSHAVVADLIGGYGVAPDRAHVVPNPVIDAPAAAPPPAPGSLNVAFVGRLVARKCPLLFVDALAELATDGASVRGTILGEGPLLDQVRARAEQRRVAVEFRGWREPWWEAAGDVDCLLVPSVVEGFGNVFVEAAAAGIPSVACSSALGTADAVVPGLTGELVYGSRPDQLADGVLRAVRPGDSDHLSEWLGRFSIERSTARLFEVLSAVVERGDG